MNVRLILRIFAIPALIIGGLAVADVVLPSNSDKAVIISKSISQGRSASCEIRAKGRFQYFESVSREMYSVAQPGMMLKISLTPIFKEWSSVELIDGKGTVLNERGQDLYAMPFVGGFLFLAALSFRNRDKLFRIETLIAICVAEFAGVLLFSKLVFVWFGWVEKM